MLLAIATIEMTIASEMTRLNSEMSGGENFGRPD